MTPGSNSTRVKILRYTGRARKTAHVRKAREGAIVSISHYGKKNVCTFKLRLCFDTVNVKNYSDWANISQAKLTLVTVIYL